MVYHNVRDIYQIYVYDGNIVGHNSFYIHVLGNYHYITKHKKLPAVTYHYQHNTQKQLFSQRGKKNSNIYRCMSLDPFAKNKMSLTVYLVHVPSSMILAAADMLEFNISSQSIRGVNAVAVTTSTSDNNSLSLLLRFSRAFSSSHLKCSFRHFLDCSALNFT